VQAVIKVLGIAALIWIGFTVLGWVLGVAFKLLLWALVIGVVLVVGSAAYAAVKGRSDRRALR
jgi:D-alanyl-lipoteichoic acid acyltransferase DltB (MBOAT superfamily)